MKKHVRRRLDTLRPSARPRPRSYPADPQQLQDLFLEKIMDRREKPLSTQHALRVFDRVLSITGDIELALFALCHQQDYKDLIKADETLAGLLNPFDFRDYALLRMAEATENSVDRIMIYSNLIGRIPQLFLVRAVDIADMAKCEPDERADTYEEKEPGIDVDKRMKSTSRAIEEVYHHIADRMEEPGLWKDLSTVRISVDYPELLTECERILDKHRSSLEVIERVLSERVLPDVVGKVSEVLTRIKLRGSLAIKLISKALELGIGSSFSAIRSVFLEGASGKAKLREEIKDLVAAEVVVEPAYRTYCVSKIEAELKRNGFRDIKIDRRTRDQGTDEKGCPKVPIGSVPYDVTYITATCRVEHGKIVTKKSGGWEYTIEIQVETPEVRREKKKGIYHHARYKGGVLLVGELENMGSVRDVIRESGESSDSLERNLVPVIELTVDEEVIGVHRIPLPPEILTIDAMAATTGLFDTKEIWILDLSKRTVREGIEWIKPGDKLEERAMMRATSEVRNFPSLRGLNSDIDTNEIALWIVTGKRTDIDPASIKDLRDYLIDCEPRTVAGKVALRMIYQEQ